jgi:hypothetical protein
MRRSWSSVALAGALCLIFAVAGFQALDMPLKAQRVPIVVAVIGGVLSLIQLAIEVRRTLVGSAASVGQEELPGPWESQSLRTYLRAVPPAFILWSASLGGLALAIWLIGGILACPMFVFLFIWLAGRRGLWQAGIHGAASFVLLYGMFDQALGVSFPAGVLFGLG